MNLQLVPLLNDRSSDPLYLLLLHLRKVVHFVLKEFVAVAEVAELLDVAVEGVDLAVVPELVEVGLVGGEEVALEGHVDEDDVFGLDVVDNSQRGLILCFVEVFDELIEVEGLFEHLVCENW